MDFKVDRILLRLADSLLPARCVLCNGPGQPPALDLCGSCQADLPALASACPRCGLPGAPRTCRACRADPPPFRCGFAPYVYAEPLSGLIRGLKYREHLAAGRVLGTLLGLAVAERGLHLDVDVLVPVPLHPAKLAERGFNQSLELGRWVARTVARPCMPRLLSRTRATPPQVGLSLAERSANLAGAFRASTALPASGRRLAVIDDVMTTGSTARAVAQALLDAGAVHVDIWCVARTPA